MYISNINTFNPVAQVAQFSQKMDAFAFDVMLVVSKKVDTYTSTVIQLDNLTVDLDLSEFKGEI